MKKALTAGLLSAFVAPGSGHFYLKHKRTGLVFFVLAILSLGLMLQQVMQVAQLISLDIQTGVLPLDIGVIAAEVTKQTTATIRDGADKLMYGFILCWLIALLDSVRLGLKQDKQDAVTAQNNA
ncbi:MULTISPECIES: DUF6677 family protein [Shewanella]|jgi:TM2 domain-containing membrane protein YozV|uniref:DUF6677 domain-containing protein n=4 Tax=Shewanella putrefaciens TaxID=24 RepID=E6XI07_SHEP2|nr:MULTISPECIES: DUF6677 family protein [Shewanella]CAD6366648.1 hypothetical protein SHEWT2_01129 [Shewanella hafniensis]ABM26350.1 conserved hypothetical protein [Shewanella sp. W3-18-1]AVV83950.1 hypothetical protein SPWS13_2161 [Shewanella putrefaciens]MCK7628844.1 hypothetical protein [Shewanella sp. JNE9-1]MCK7634899.1 hypothetical protein [Shewanella sp. JNE17]